MCSLLNSSESFFLKTTSSEPAFYTLYTRANRYCQNLEQKRMLSNFIIYELYDKFYKNISKFKPLYDTKKMHHRLIEAGIKCLVGGADDGNLNETYTKKAIKCHHLNLTFDILSITLCDGYTHIFMLNVNVPRLIVCSTCLNSDVGRDFVTSTYAIKSMTFTMLP
jgi:hypothetical protein